MTTYTSLVARIRANKEATQLHMQHTLKAKFLCKLKPSVQLHFDCTKLSSLEEAFA